MLKTLRDNVEEVLGCILLVAVCVVAVIKIASRYLLRNPSSWAEEVATYLFVWLVFIGAAAALKARQHFAIDLLAARLPGRAAAAVRIVAGLLVVVFCVVVVWFGARLAVGGWHTRTPATEIPRSVPYAAVPVGGLLMLWRASEQLLREFRALAAQGRSRT